MASQAGLRYQPVRSADLPVITALYQRAVTVDGGTPFAAEDWLLRRWYGDDIEASLAAWSDGTLAGVCSRRRADSAEGPRSMVAGQVDPDYRGQGIGSRLLDFALGGTDPAATARVENESLTEAADALYRSRGLRQIFAENVLGIPLDAGPPVVTGAIGLSYLQWTPATAPRFYAVWQAAFRERPGFPGWTADRWIEWISDDDDFRAAWTLLAVAGGSDLGFVAGAAGGWIVQTGVIPAARGQRISSALIAEVFRRMIEAGETRGVLTVNVNNPSAIAVYQRLGFRLIGRRARYER